MMSTSPRVTVAFALCALTLSLQAACARAVVDDAGNDRVLSPNTPAPLTACVATECPQPFATCPGGGHLCATDTSRDVLNCGGCGNVCPHADHSLNATAVCSDSVCAIACDALFADCDRDGANGCEVSVSDDPKNCGGCGHECKAGEICWRGACGCPTGFTACGSECKDLMNDGAACGACDVACAPPKTTGDAAWKCGPGVQPSQTTWGCIAGVCQMTCKPFYGDCNGDLCSDGCETDERTSEASCGACGHACSASQECVDGECLCPEGTTRCGDRCVDTAVDTENCGACGNACPGASDDTANGGPTCKGGHCGYVCQPGFADCNGRINDGCEVNIGTDPRHCGACGTRCDTARSQPCVLGQCLTKPCEAPEATR